MHAPANCLAVFKLNLQIELKLISTTFNFSKFLVNQEISRFFNLMDVKRVKKQKGVI